MAFEKRYTAKQAAEAVLKKAQEVLEKSELAKKEHKSSLRKDAPMPVASPAPSAGPNLDPAKTKAFMQGFANAKSEQMKSELIKKGLSPNDVHAQMKKYESEMSGKVGYKPSKLGAEEVDQEKTDRDYKVKANPPKNALGPESPASGKNSPMPEVQKSESDRLREQTPPGNNPKEQAEGNNELAGTTPTQVGQDGKNIPGGDEIRGHLKLAKFIGRMEHKRSIKRGVI